jgi:transportin-1
MNVCRAISLIVNEKPDALLPHMHSICQFMLRAQADEDEAVAIEAGEFWPTCCYSDAKSTVQALLPELIPILLSRMRYSEEELAELRVDGDDNEGIPDRPEDIRPLFHKGGGGGNGGDEDDGDDDDDEGLYAWTVRKCCAAALDHLATCMGGPGILPCLLPVLQEMLGNHGDVWARESAILALGAVSEGCMQGMDEHLPQLLPFLLGQMEDAVPQARSISCWTLSRYSGWICQAPEGNPWLGPALDALVRRVLDCNKKVQEAACSALATLEEMLGERLVGEALDRVLAALTMALGKYQMRSLIILYDTIGTLADVVGGALSEERRVAVLMPPLMAKWESVPDGDRHLFPLLECLTSISQALGMAFQPFAPRLFYRSVALVQSTLLGHAAVAELGGDAPDMEFAVCALDLISGMMEGMGGSMESLVTESNLLLLLDKCLQEKDSALQQSACALVGDLAKSAFARLAPALQQYMPHLIARLRAPPQQPASVCNNASWAISEICTRWGGEAMLRWVPLIMERIIPLLSQGGAAQDLHQNLAITLGHLVVTCPALLAQECASFAEGWCRAMNTIEEDADRRQMLEALALLIRTNPSSMLPFLPSVCVALANSVVSDRGTLESYAHIFASYRSIMGEAAWAELWQRLPGRVVRYLRDDCKIVQLP